MFKKDLTTSSKTKLKSSVQRSLRSRLVATYPLLNPYVDTFLPKKSQLDLIKLPDARATLYALNGVPLFFQHMDDALIPHLSLVHRYPDAFPRLRVDRGAVRFVLSGAALMVPGFTSPGGRLPSGSYVPPAAPAADDGDAAAAAEGEEDADDGGKGKALEDGAAAGVPEAKGLSTSDEARYHDQPELEEGTVVIVEAEGKEHACAIGVLKMGTKEMKANKKGIGIENGHYLGDGLWRIKID